MTISGNDPTFDALDKYVTHKQEPNDKKVLRVATKDGHTYLEFVSKKNMSLLDRMKALFGKSEYNLHNVLSVIEDTTTDTISGKNGETLLKAAAKITKGVQGHHTKKIPKKIESAVEKIQKICSSPSLLKAALLEEAKDQDITQGPFRGNEQPALRQIILNLKASLENTGLVTTVTKMIQDNKTADEILETIIVNLENSQDPTFKEMGTILKDTFQTMINDADKKQIPIDKRHIKDAARFTTGVFVLRAFPILFGDAYKSNAQAAMGTQKVLTDSVNKYINGADSPLFDRLTARLT